MSEVPKHYWMVTGKGVGRSRLTAFDAALLDAGIGDYNLLKVSSILPPGAISMKGPPEATIPKGAVVPCVVSEVVLERGSTSAAATGVGVAIPEDSSNIGVIMEASGVGTSSADSQRHLADMCRESMAMRNIDVQEIRLATCDMEGAPETSAYIALVAAVVFSPPWVGRRAEG